MPATSLDQIVSLCKRRGFVFPGSEIYGGLSNSWDYGPVGTELKNAIRDWWWERFVTKRQDMVGIDAAILMNPKVWESSGHVSNFNDAMIDCKQCKGRFRADHLIEDKFPDMKVDGRSPEELTEIIHEKGIACPKCGTKDSFTEARTFNLLFRTQLGSLQDSGKDIYIRGEIAQAMFVNFKSVQQTTRKRLPFGIASVGKAFRNEITPGNFTFRTLEFDLMEFEYFIHSEEWEKWFEYWVGEQQAWLEEMGVDPKKLRVRQHTEDELSHYSTKTVDIEYETPFGGWKELFGCAYRTDFDLKNHMEQSKQDLQYTDPESGEKFIPHVIEPTFGLSRCTLIVLLDAYDEEELENGETRTVMRFHPRIAPIQVAILPLSKDERLIAKAQEIYSLLTEKTNYRLDFDITGSIGKRYRRQDEIGTPTCITVDFGTIGDDDNQCKADHVTVRDRDSLEQKEVAIEDLVELLG